MDHEGAPNEASEATPIFGAYRRGYDPEQVDRYVADQQHRLDEALHRASEGERRLAAAVGQLRELHRRVATLESEERPAQTAAPALDTLGERVQRILQEAWEGAYALRQNAEQEAAEIRERVATEAQDILSSARRKAEMIDAEIERRRRGYLQKLEEDRARAVAQIKYLHEQRQSALNELLRVKDVIEETVADVAPLRKEAPAQQGMSLDPLDSMPLRLHIEGAEDLQHEIEDYEGLSDEHEAGPEPTERPNMYSELPVEEDGLARTMPVHHLPSTIQSTVEPDRSSLVQSHRASLGSSTRTSIARNARATTTLSHQGHAAVFDFDAQ